MDFSSPSALSDVDLKASNELMRASVLGLIDIWDALPVACLARLPVLALEPAGAAAEVSGKAQTSASAAARLLFLPCYASLSQRMKALQRCAQVIAPAALSMPALVIMPEAVVANVHKCLSG